MIHIAIDGPAGAGKSTVAKAIAGKLNILHLDTGAMYRALAYYAISNSVSPADANGVARIIDGARIRIKYVDSAQRTILNGEDITGLIRTPEVSRGASDIGVHPFVRKKLVELQQQVARENSVVMDGRDICTVVMPDAKHKFFITASVEIRAKRRLLEMQQSSNGELPTLTEIERAIIERDHTDSTRAAAPLKQTEDAILVDTTNMTIDESVDFVLSSIMSSKENS